MRCVLVSHTHWDREWYRTFQAFRARLVDTIDRILELLALDPGYRFQLDGQTIVLEDYVAVRPERRQELADACRASRIAIGPWYVQPDSLLPAGESHVRNLLEGRRVARDYGPCATVAYTPDSFGHPAQFPQLFAGFDLSPFIYWRGNGNEIADLPAEYRWIAPDGSEVTACHLGKGYFNAWGLPDDPEQAAKRLERVGRELRERAPRDVVLLMNGIDHMLPDTNTLAVAEALSKRTGWEVQRGLLDDYARGLDASSATPKFQGELCGGRVANLLPGVWSTRTYLKLRNRRCEMLLSGWAEPFAALGAALGTPRENASLRSAWRDVLANQAHDSICGCSQDRVHDQMLYRYDAAEELAYETATRLLERIAGLGTGRQPPSSDPKDPSIRRKNVALAVFNPSPAPRTDVVRLPLSGFPAFTAAGVNPLLAKNHAAEGFTVDGEPARLIEYTGTARPRLVPGEPVYDLEFLARDVPAFGWKRMELARAPAAPEAEDDDREIRAGDVTVVAAADGTLTVELGGRRYAGIGGIEDTGDRGDTYDYDPAPDGHGAGGLDVRKISIRRFLHPNGQARLVIERTLRVPAALGVDRATRGEIYVDLPVRVEARIRPGVERVDLTVRIDNTARDHRLRLLFPSGAATEEFTAATTLDTARRVTGRPADTGWIHPAPHTFPHQGWISANGLTVVAPGLAEGEVDRQGIIAVTLLRATGWLSRPDLTTRPGEAGPALPTPGAQCPGPLEARIFLLSCDPAEIPAAARDAELGLFAVAAGDVPLSAPDHALLHVSPVEALVSALKPADDGDGIVLRLLNPTDQPLRAEVTLGIPTQAIEGIRLDETPLGEHVSRDGDIVEIELPPHALRSLLLR